MTRKKYISILEKNITTLTDAEKMEAIQYYTDYFEEADDDEKVIEELGAPEELAKTIMEKFSNAVSSKEETNKTSEDQNNSTKNYSDAYSWSFKNEDISALSINVGACHTVIIPGKDWSIETRGIRKESFFCSIKNGKLTIDNTKRIDIFDFFNHDRKSRIVPRILITIPENTNLDELQIKLEAGLLKTHTLSLSGKRCLFTVGAGNLELDGINAENANLHCGMGNITFKGKLTGKANIDCGMGNISLLLSDSEENFSYDCKIGLGEFKFNEKKFAGISQNLPENKKKNHLSVNVGMGSVNCKTEK